MENVSSSKLLPELRKVYNVVQPYGLVGAYGIDLKSLREDGRPEIVIEGSMDQQKWTVRKKSLAKRLIIQATLLSIPAKFFFPKRRVIVCSNWLKLIIIFIFDMSVLS